MLDDNGGAPAFALRASSRFSDLQDIVAEPGLVRLRRLHYLGIVRTAGFDEHFVSMHDVVDVAVVAVVVAVGRRTTAHPDAIGRFIPTVAPCHQWAGGEI